MAPGGRSVDGQWLAGTMRPMGTARVGIEPAVVLRQAAELTGAPDVVLPTEVVGLLDVLCASLHAEAALTMRGRLLAHDEVLRALTNRFLLERLAPAKGDEAPIVTHHHALGCGPLIITGLPRTGTTYLHGLLAATPMLRAVTFWEARRPAARALAGSGEVPDAMSVARFESALLLDHLYKKAPELRGVHAMDVDEPEECAQLLQVDLRSSYFEAGFFVPSYTRALLDADMAPAYDIEARLLDLIGGRVDVDPPARLEPSWRWVVKNPDTLRCYTTAADHLGADVVVWCHRDPVDVVTSWCSLVALTRSASAKVERTTLGAEWLVRLANGYHEARRLRTARPDVVVVDVDYDHLVACPDEVVADVTAACGVCDTAISTGDVSGSDEAATRRETHTYAPEDFGLDRDQIRDAFRTSAGEAA